MISLPYKATVYDRALVEGMKNFVRVEITCFFETVP